MDLLDPVAIDAFAERYLTSCQPLHILVNSAGIMANPLTRQERLCLPVGSSARPVRGLTQCNREHAMHLTD
jgi:NAD(P)-dependent dehydrogenase (short-subunit alcohol dehydrogenase family)